MKLISLVTAATAALILATPTLAHGNGETVATNFEQKIPNIPGKTLIAVTVDYAPGAESAPHIHADSAFIYAFVVSGAVESQVDDGPVQVYRAGESFYETPGSTHPVSRNASKTAPARLLAVFVVDDAEVKDITTNVDQH